MTNGQLPSSDMQSEYLDDDNNPSICSQVYVSVWEDILLIRTLLHGARALRAARETYLPKFELETTPDYLTRVSFAPLSNYFVTAHRNITSRPFTKPVTLQGDISDNIRSFADDVTGGGDNLHTFLRDVYERAAAYGKHGILIDYPTANNDATLADERSNGATPYWCHVPADRLIACETSFFGGQERVTHARIVENSTVRMGFKESLVKRVRVLDHQEGCAPTWGLYEYQEAGPNNKARWFLTGTGQISMPFIPLVIFTTGVDEQGSIVPPMLDLAHLQIEHYQQSSTLKNVLQLAGFPMLTGNGISAPVDSTGELETLTVGPRAVLFAPPNTTGQNASWGFIEPQGTSIQRIMENIERLERDMAMAGMQPLMKSSGGVTATAEAINAARAHSTAEAWAMDLMDVAEQALAFTSIWFDEPTSAKVYIHTDFGIELKNNNDITSLLLARDKNVISTQTTWDELRRRDFLGPQFDPTKEVEKIIDDPTPPPTIATLRGEGQPPGIGVRPPVTPKVTTPTTPIDSNMPKQNAPAIAGRNNGSGN